MRQALQEMRRGSGFARGIMRKNVRKTRNEAGYTRKIGEEFAV